MTYSHPFLLRIPFPTEASPEVVADLLRTLETLHASAEHPHADLASHVLDLHVAAARVVETSGETHVDLGIGIKTLSHTCEGHIEAALLILGAGHKPGPEPAQEVLRRGLLLTRQLLTG